MKTIKFRFYSARKAKADGRKMSLIEKIIDLRSELTHVECQFDENRGYISWSSTGADGANGCRFKYITYGHIGYWITLAFVVTDEEESRLWTFCCDCADLAWNWQEKPYDSCTYTATVLDGQDMFAARIKDLTIYKGQNHIKYDYYGLLTFALESAPTWWVNIARWAVWGWTKVILPNPNKLWCSEACSKAFNSMNRKTIWPTEIDPGQMYETMKQMKGVIVL